ncbi:hypothetical protein BJ912DRAFT_992974 [Pholiota molesta]|nr:hypothetical protein BJ912DRAFT_992974 [Pholiota molesta]
MDAHDRAFPSAPPRDFRLPPFAQSTDAFSETRQQQQPQHPVSGGSDPPASAVIASTDEPATCIKRKRTAYRCYNCGTTTASAWRRSAKTPGKVVCNRCGLIERTKFFGNPVRRPDAPRQTAALVTPALRAHDRRTRASHPYAASRTLSISSQPEWAPDIVSGASLSQPDRDHLDPYIPPPFCAGDDNRRPQHPGAFQDIDRLQLLETDDRRTESGTGPDE